MRRVKKAAGSEGSWRRFFMTVKDGPPWAPVLVLRAGKRPLRTNNRPPFVGPITLKKKTAGQLACGFRIVALRSVIR